MAHATPLTESQVRQVDVHRHSTKVLEQDLTYDDISEAQARRVDEKRHADAHAAE